MQKDITAARATSCLWIWPLVVYGTMQRIALRILKIRRHSLIEEVKLINFSIYVLHIWTYILTGPRRQLSNFERHSHSFNIAGIAGSGQPSVEELQGASERKSDSHFTNGDGNRNSSTVLKPYYPSSSSSSSSMSMYLGFVSIIITFQ